MNNDLKTFVKNNLNEDIRKLALKKKLYPNIDFKFALNQIEGYQKTKNKIPYLIKFEDIIYPKMLSMEQCSSETTALYKSQLCSGNLLIDLTGGFGIDCMFMAANFKKAVYVEQNSELFQIVEHNYHEVLKLNHVEVINESTEAFLNSNTKHADWMYIDPARRDSAGNKVISISDCEPDLKSLLPKILSSCDNLMIKLSPMMDISKAIGELKNVSEIHVVAVENECKELLIIIKNKLVENVHVTTINFRKSGYFETFRYGKDEESTSKSNFSDTVLTYLYEPNAAILKSGAFKLIGERFDISKLHPHTHLYTSNKFIPNFPGRSFEVINVSETKEAWKNIKRNYPKANLSTRNFPLTSAQLKKKIGIDDGGDFYLFGCTMYDGKKIIIECKKTK
jgi:THUMP domain-like